MERIVGGRKEGFQLALREDGAYLTVYPEEPDADVVDLSALREKIEAAGVMDYDVLQLAYLVRSAEGVEEKLNAATENGEDNLTIPFTIEIPNDAMSAAVRFDDKKGNLPPSVADVL
ncbi:MAG: DUF342 domain-containing protein, partial [Selenomonas sp.]|nr:DUF342 domain-containing protein [Selenomonas sp.]